MVTLEQSRLLNYNDGQTPSNGCLTFTAYTQDAVLKLKLIKDVIQAVASVDQKDWPSDEKWEIILPKWFIIKIKSHSDEDLETMSDLLWDYGSWLDAMKFRGWQWYSSKVENNKITINLLPETFPYSVNPLEYVIYETGVNLKDIYFKESTPP